jgi:hypothetical protein
MATSLHLDGYKAMVDHVHKATGIVYSTEAIRKIIDRDAVLSGVRTWFNGIPRLQTSVLNDWIDRANGRARRRGAVMSPGRPRHR